MLSWALIFLVVAIISGLCGFTGIAKSSAWMAKTLFFIFLILFLAGMIVTLMA